MGLNSLYSKQNSVITDSLLPAVQTHLSRWRSAATVEQRLLIEAEIVQLFEQLLTLNFPYLDIKKGEYPEFIRLIQSYQDSDRLSVFNASRIKAASKAYLDASNNSKIGIASFLGKVKRLKQKLAALQLTQDNDAAFVIVEKFLNLERISSEFISQPSCSIDTNQGIATLPIAGVFEPRIESVRIGSQSNGLPGNSDVRVTVSNTNPKNVLNSNNTWFDYERLDMGPLRLDLLLTMSNEEIINRLEIDLVSQAVGQGFEIVDVKFINLDNTETSMRELAPQRFKSERFIAKLIKDDLSLAINFPPTRAKTIVLVLNQNETGKISYLLSNDRKILRNRFGIAIRQIKVQRQLYDSVGSVGSRELVVPTGLFAVLPEVSIEPAGSNLHSILIATSFDGGETWVTVPSTQTGFSPLPLNGTQTSMLYRIDIARNDKEFEFITSFKPEQGFVKNVNSTLQAVSRFQSPATIGLAEKVRDGELFVMQPGILKRGGRNRLVTLGQLSDFDTSLALPIVIGNQVEPDDLKVFINRRKLSRSETRPGLSTWKLSDSLNEIELSADAASGEVQAGLTAERMLFRDQGVFLYHEMEFLFDPDKESIDIFYLEREQQRQSITLPRNKKTIVLGYKSILNGTIFVKSKAGDTWTEVTSKSSLTGASKSFWLDYKNGVLYLSEATGQDTLRFIFSHQSPTRLEQDSFEIAYNGVRPTGILVYRDAFRSQRATERIGDTASQRISIITEENDTRDSDLLKDPGGDSTARMLTHDFIVQGSVTVSNDLFQNGLQPQELEFIDGRSEFLGLLPILDEETVELTAGTGVEFVEFNLSAGSLWHSASGITFEDATIFANEVSSKVIAEAGSLGDYFVSDAGLVTVNVGSGGTLEAGVGIQYLFRDPSADASNKYSINYREGILYSDSLLNDDASISYNASHYKIHYNLAQAIETFSFNPASNSISVRTEELSSINNSVKVLWKPRTGNQQFQEMVNYYSPHLNSVSFRFQ